jgi:hypothetical protein
MAAQKYRPSAATAFAPVPIVPIAVSWKFPGLDHL